jgi:hypothetical protein
MDKQHAQTARESNNNTDLEQAVSFVSGFVLYAFVVCDVVVLSLCICSVINTATVATRFKPSMQVMLLLVHIVLYA